MYEVVIGLETHAELNTNTKIFCGCKNEYGAPVNTLCCPICMGMPGTLPVLNKKVVDYAMMMGLALNCDINKNTKHDRKNYFYPDLPKAYQISQYDIPICANGHIEFYVEGVKRSVRVGRVHIEEDAGKLLHDDRFGGSLVDMNRCGVPLIEIVSEPDMRSAAEAKAYLEAIVSVLRYLGISNCKMQEGNIRCDVNVSLMPKGSSKLGNRVEMKNINTFSGVFDCIQYEIERQTNVLSSGGKIDQETRKWDDVACKTVPMRSKQNAEDYRYFPEPDLVSIKVDDAWIAEIKAQIPELPLVKYERYFGQYGLSQYEAEMLSSDKERAEYFEACIAVDKKYAKQICNRILGDIAKLVNERSCKISDIGVAPSDMVKLIELTENGTLSSTASKKVFDALAKGETDPVAIVERLGLAQVSDTDALAKIVEEVLSENAGPVEDFKGGKTNVLGFLVGICMKKSAGKGNPQIFRDLLTEKLK